MMAEENPKVTYTEDRWKPKDPRRKRTFVIAEVNGDTVRGDDGRNVQIGRLFRRYVRV